MKAARLGTSESDYKRLGLYIRMTGTITVERFEGDVIVEALSEKGIWEQMYFGLDEDV